MTRDKAAPKDDLGSWIGLGDVLASALAMAASFLIARTSVFPDILARVTDKAYFASNPLLFEVRRSGFSYETARDHMRALGDTARDYYANTFLPIYDLASTLFVLLFAVLFILYATQPGKTYALDVSPAVRRIMLVPPVCLFLLDVGAKISVRAMLEAYPRINQKLVETASMFVGTKWLAIFVTTMLLVGLAVFTLYRMIAKDPEPQSEGVGQKQKPRL